ncbi:helix-turn-helix domain-containing protein [Microbacterium sp. NPDC019599]|uniref:helix-turn-helix transcriptional regulator n=1 Tax=Microbacterium sp. NPDC019599 TaxID=3154690 RepID=UPI0033C49656
MRDYVAAGLDEVLTTSELAEYLGVKPQVIYDLRRTGEGPRGFHVGKELRYCVPEIRAWLESRADPSRGSAARAG